MSRLRDNGPIADISVSYVHDEVAHLVIAPNFFETTMWRMYCNWVTRLQTPLQPFPNCQCNQWFGWHTTICSAFISAEDKIVLDLLQIVTLTW